MGVAGVSGVIVSLVVYQNSIPEAPLLRMHYRVDQRLDSTVSDAPIPCNRIY